MTTANGQATSGAALLLTLYQLPTEDKLRRARAWFSFQFHPKSVEDVLGAWLAPGHENAPYRMVTTYWEMAASLVGQGAISAEMSPGAPAAD
jgi:hypothetical protein